MSLVLIHPDPEEPREGQRLADILAYALQDRPVQTVRHAGELTGLQGKTLLFAIPLGSLGIKKSAKPKPANRERLVNFGGKDTQVLLFSPKSFDEAGELVNYMHRNMTVVMTLEGVPTDMARRLLDFLSGIAFALQGKITPVSAKTYFITPQNVDILGTEAQQPESAGHYF